MTQKQIDALAFKRAAKLIKDANLFDGLPFTSSTMFNNAKARVVKMLEEWDTYLTKVK